MSHITIKRIFHPIGHGAFYTEAFTPYKERDVFRMVYDCGTITSKKAVKPEDVIKDSFERNGNECIDVLFISHFDEDHVNCITILKKEYVVKKVIVPLLKPDERSFLVNFYKGHGDFDDLVELIEAPETYFGEQTQVFYINADQEVDFPTNGNENANNSSYIDELDQRDDRILPNRFILKVRNKSWRYIPYNIDFHERSKKLRDALKKCGIDMSKIISDVDYAIENRELLRSIYKKIGPRSSGSKNINQNSMFLYSGPAAKYSLGGEMCDGTMNTSCGCVGCIYTGDGDTNKVDTTKIFGDYVNHVGTAQVPHHGSKHDYNPKNFPLLWRHPVSVGAERKLHPSSEVVNSLNNRLKMVTEVSSTKYQQDIHHFPENGK